MKRGSISIAIHVQCDNGLFNVSRQEFRCILSELNIWLELSENENPACKEMLQVSILRTEDSWFILTNRDVCASSL